MNKTLGFMRIVVALRYTVYLFFKLFTNEEFQVYKRTEYILCTYTYDIF